MVFQHRNKSVMSHDFSMVPRADIPRSVFQRDSGYKTSFDAGYLVPVFVEEVLPGDSFNVKMTAFARLATPLLPFMDNLFLDSFFFFVPNRLVWDNWQKFMGEQINPGDSIDYTVPTATTPTGGYAIGSLQDYMGLPTAGQVGVGATVTHANLFPRAYNLIWNEWFRDENMQNSVTVDLGDGPDTYSNYVLLRRGKRHDYFTSCLPWPQKGSAVTIPLSGNAPVIPDTTTPGTTNIPKWTWTTGGQQFGFQALAVGVNNTVEIDGTTTGSVNSPAPWAQSGLVADLSSVTAATINALRLSFQTQKLLERDARGGTRYTEILRSHFGVVSPDARLQRPEYLGGGSTPVVINPITQTSATGLTGSDTPQGNLAAMGTALAHNHGFTKSFVEHGLIIGLVSVRADLTYQQGLQRMWSRSTRYDYYFPAFACIGEQSVLNKEIYCDGSSNDSNVFGYQEHWAEYRYRPSVITSLMRSTASNTIDAWHLSQKFISLPTLNSTFIADSSDAVVNRASAVVAGGGSITTQQFIFDAMFNFRAARPMPMYSVPGLIDHF